MKLVGLKLQVTTEGEDLTDDQLNDKSLREIEHGCDLSLTESPRSEYEAWEDTTNAISLDYFTWYKTTGQIKIYVFCDNNIFSFKNR